MNYNKLNGILRVIENGGDLPTDRWGEILSCDDMAVWFRLNEFLLPNELDYMKQRLVELAETQKVIEMMKLPQL